MDNPYVVIIINVNLVVIHLIPLITIIITITSLFLYQLEEHMTYLVCEVELNKENKILACN